MGVSFGRLVIYLSDVLPTSYHGERFSRETDRATCAYPRTHPPFSSLIHSRRRHRRQGRRRRRYVGSRPDWTMRRPLRLPQGRQTGHRHRRCPGTSQDGQAAGAEVINFKEVKDIPAKIYEMIDIGLDVAIDCGSFHSEPKSMLHKIEKALMLETDVSETANEMIKSVRRYGELWSYRGVRRVH